MTQSTNPLWEDGAWEALPALRGDVAAGVCVVGLGGSGLAAIDELLAMGIDVVGIDAASIAGAAAGRNGGFLRAGLAAFHHDAVRRYGRERAGRLYRLTAAERDRLIRAQPDVVRRCGYLRLASDTADERDCRAQLAAMEADDLPASWYEGPLGRGILVADDAAANPLARCRQAARRLLARGARLYEQSPAWRVTGSVIETPDGRVSCRAVVVTIDGGLARLLPELADRVRAARLQMLGTAPEPPRFPYATGARGGWDYWQQGPDGRIALGGCRDAGGDAEWTEDDQPTEAVQERLEDRLRRELQVDAPITHRWAASVSYTGSGLPIVEEVRPRVWGAGAYSGTGNLLGPVCARWAARMAVGDTTESLV